MTQRSNIQELVDSRRVRALKESSASLSGPVVYVMGRDQRVSDNWALLFAASKARELSVPLLVLFAIGPMFLAGSRRHNDWLIGSLQSVAQNLATLSIPFYIETGDWAEVVMRFAKQQQARVVVFDQNPLEPVRSWRTAAAAKLTAAVYEVDAHNIVPVWEASDKQEFAAYTIRPKIHKKLSEFLTEFPKLPTLTTTFPAPVIDWAAIARFRIYKNDVPLKRNWQPGEAGAHQMLQQFIDERLKGYAVGRNDPNQEHLSDLSPYLRWGNISAQRVALTIKNLKGYAGEDKQAFLEELIVRRELSDNFVFYNSHYNVVEGAHAWAQETIKAHKKDKREYLYSYEEFEAGETHDALWNAAQMEMVNTGKMHGYLRMYWAKKILEWTPDAQTAIDYALKLNDTYELDGRDSNGVVGVMWSICGVHDRAWTERPVFGKIRYMNYNGCKRKFNVDAYIAKHMGSETSSML